MKKLLGTLVLLGALTIGFGMQTYASESVEDTQATETVGTETNDGKTTEIEATKTDAATGSVNTEMYDEKAAVVAYQLVYVNDIGYEEVLKAGYGFFVGDKTQSVYMITCYNTVILTEAEKQDIAARFGIEENKINTKIKIYLKGDITVEATLETGSAEMDFAIVKPATDLSGCTTLRLCEDANINANGTPVYSFKLPILATDSDATTADIQRIDGEIQDWADIDEVHYYKYNMSDVPVPGMPVINERGEVIAVNTNISATASGYYASIQINEIIEVMNVLGFVYNPEIVIDMEAATAIITEYEELQADLYTEETWVLVEESYQELIEVKKRVDDGDLDYYTQGELDSAVGKLRTAIDGLEEPVKEVDSKKVIIIAIIVGSVLFVVILTLVIVMLVNKSKYKKKLQEEKDNKQSAMEILKMSGRITPGSIQNNVNGLPTNRSLDGVGYGEGYTEGGFSSETTVLSQAGYAMDDATMMSGHLYQEQFISYPTLTRNKTGESVTINKNSFIIGKSPDMVDYCIRYNSNISRKHVCIIKMEDGYYIQDLDTTNGTYVNDIRVSGNRSVKLEDGCIIKMAEEEFVFSY